MRFLLLVVLVAAVGCSDSKQPWPSVVTQTVTVVDKSDEYQEGRRAFGLGVPANANPHAHGTVYYPAHNWLKGWMDAKEKAKHKGETDAIILADWFMQWLAMNMLRVNIPADGTRVFVE